jgi:restriction endonuclease S subunit
LLAEKKIREGWKVFKLGECLKLINGRAYGQSELLSNGTYQVIRIQNLNGGANWYYSDLQLDSGKFSLSPAAISAPRLLDCAALLGSV